MREWGSMESATRPSPVPDECGGGAFPRGGKDHADGVDVPPVRYSDPDGGAGLLRQVRLDRASPTLSDLALALVNGDRQAAYGEPVEHAEKVAGVWRAMFGWDVDGHKFAIAMAALKLVREQNRPKQDSRVDAVGWMEIADRIVAAKERP